MTRRGRPPRGRPGAVRVETRCVSGEGGPCPFYERAGFVHAGAEEEGERVLRLEL